MGTPTWPQFLCLGTSTWPPWRHVKTIYSKPNQQYSIQTKAIIHIQGFGQKGSFAGLNIAVWIPNDTHRSTMWLLAAISISSCKIFHNFPTEVEINIDHFRRHWREKCLSVLHASLKATSPSTYCLERLRQREAIFVRLFGGISTLANYLWAKKCP